VDDLVVSLEQIVMAKQQSLEFPDAPASNKKWSLYQDANTRAAVPDAQPLDASAREQALRVALAHAKALINELRSRVVRADSVAYVLIQSAPAGAQLEFCHLMRRVLSADDDLSLRTAKAVWASQRGSE
jgi:hypothetical protein